jgi:hypothetical protein
MTIVEADRAVVGGVGRPDQQGPVGGAARTPGSDSDECSDRGPPPPVPRGGHVYRDVTRDGLSGPLFTVPAGADAWLASVRVDQPFT